MQVPGVAPSHLLMMLWDKQRDESRESERGMVKGGEGVGEKVLCVCVCVW